MPYKDSQKRKDYDLQYYHEKCKTDEGYVKRHRERARKQRRENREMCLLYNKRYRKKHREKIGLYRNRWQNERKKNDVMFRLNGNVASAICISLQGKKEGRKWETLVGYTLQDLMRHLERLFAPEMSWENYGSYWWIDHVKPRTAFNEEEFRECWALNNLQPMEKIANIKKSNCYKNEPVSVRA